MTLQPVVEQQNESPDKVNLPSFGTKDPAEELIDMKSGNQLHEDIEKTVINTVDMEIEAEDACVLAPHSVIITSPVEPDVSAASIEITTMSPKSSSKANEERSTEVNDPTPMELTLCAERFVCLY